MHRKGQTTNQTFLPLSVFDREVPFEVAVFWEYSFARLINIQYWLEELYGGFEPAQEYVAKPSSYPSTSMIVNHLS